MSNKLRLLQKKRNAKVVNAYSAIDLKLAYMYKNEDLTKFGFNRMHPEFTLDVNDNVNVNDDYYIRKERYLPTGSILPFAGSAVTGVYWLLCNGQSILKKDYSKLFDVIGYTYGGSGDFFNLPDLRGRVPIGAGTGTNLSARTLAATGGAEEHTLTLQQIPSHSHTYDDFYRTNTQGVIDGLSTAADETSTDASRTTGTTGGSQPHNNMQPFIVLNYIIRI
jgi:microcystin-dependent protein